MLNKLMDNLPRALLAAFRNRRSSQSLSHHCPGNNPSNRAVLRLCNTAGQYLDDSHVQQLQASSMVHVSSVRTAGSQFTLSFKNCKKVCTILKCLVFQYLCDILHNMFNH